MTRESRTRAHAPSASQRLVDRGTRGPSGLAEEPDDILPTVLDVAGELLANRDRGAAIEAALAMLGEALDVIRVGLLQDVPALRMDEPRSWRIVHEWHRPDVPGQIGSPGEIGEYPDKGCLDALMAGHVWLLDVTDDPTAFAGGQPHVRTASILSVPVFAGGRYWGILCLQESMVRPWTAHETASLLTVAAHFGAAQGRAEWDGERLALEREHARAHARRDALLTSATEALKCLLGAGDFESAVADALRMVGEAAELHRVKVILRRPARPGEAPAHELTYEWWAPWLASQTSLGITHFPDAIVEADYLVPLMAGRSVFKFIDEVDASLRAGFELAGMRSMGVVPIFIGKEFAGMIAFDDCIERRVFSSGEMKALTITGSALGAAIYRREAQKRDAAHAAELSVANAQLQLANDAIRATTSRLASEQSLDTFLDLLLSELARALGTKSAALARYDAETDTLHLAAMVDERPGAEYDIPARVRRQDLPTWDLIVKAPRLWVDLEREPHLNWPGTSSYLRSRGLGACIHLPIRSGAATIGTISFAFPRAPLFSTTQEGLIEVFSAQAALALHLTRLAAETREAAASHAITEERNRLAGDIHDGLAQAFTSIALQSEALLTDVDEGSPHREPVSVIAETARIGLVQARSSALALRAVGEGPGDLEAVLESLAKRCSISGATTCQFISTGDPCSLSADARAAILRVAQEAVTNALRHSRAVRVIIRLDVCEGFVTLSVDDDGVGIPNPASAMRRGLGLAGMETRALAVGGTLIVQGALGGVGTSVCLRIPTQPNESLFGAHR